MDREGVRGRAVVMQPGDGPSYWQPVPANGHADPKLFPGNTGFDGLTPLPRVPVDDGWLRYEVAGDGPPLLLVPGLGGLGSFWQHQVAAFAGDFRVIVHDHRGCGRSSRSRIAYSVEQMADDVLQLMDALGIEAAHFVGHSTGGAIGQVIAQDRPE